MSPVSAARLRRLDLTGFRNYADLTWAPRGRLVVLHGANGTGKTNLLEAISLLAPGRGMRGARAANLARQGPGATGGWAVAGRFDTPLGAADISTGSRPDGAEGRVFRLDGATPRSQREIASRVAAVWLTPQMDRLFVAGAAGRRRFLDRLVLALEPGHARQLAAYETAMAGRNRLLREAAEPAWLDSLEDAMARHAVAATAARRTLVLRLDAALRDGAAAPFPAARLSLVDPIADRLSGPALLAEDWLRQALAAQRVRDAAAGSAGLGAHRADLALADATTGRPASEASTGQQKAMLVGVVLGHAALIASLRGAVPLLLLDEPAVHLDQARRVALFEALVRLPGQTLLTGTDSATFAPLRDAAEGFQVAGDRLHPDPAFCSVA